MKLPRLTAIGTHLVLGVDHASRLVVVESAPTAAAAERIATGGLGADIPTAIVVRIENQALGNGERPRVPEAVQVPVAKLAPDACVVIGAAEDDSVVSVRWARSLASAYQLERVRLSPSTPRAIIGVVHARATPSAETPKSSRRRR